MPLVALELGIEMADPINDPWPATAAEIPTNMRVDMDGDGSEGVVAHYSGENGYSYARTSSSVFGTSRTDQVDIASRVTFSLQGALTSCETSAGTAAFTHLNARLYACQHPDDTACTTTEADFLDTNLIQYTPGAASYQLSRVADGASCADIRAALP